MNDKYLIWLCIVLGILWGFGFGCILKNKCINELEYINNQLRLEYDELKENYNVLEHELTSCYYALNKTEEYCHSN